jgi:hypothetical protein
MTRRPGRRSAGTPPHRAVEPRRRAEQLAGPVTNDGTRVPPLRRGVSSDKPSPSDGGAQAGDDRRERVSIGEDRPHNRLFRLRANLPRSLLRAEAIIGPVVARPAIEIPKLPQRYAAGPDVSHGLRATMIGQYAESRVVCSRRSPDMPFVVARGCRSGHGFLPGGVQRGSVNSPVRTRSSRRRLDRGEELQLPAQQLGVAAVAALGQPGRPLVVPALGGHVSRYSPCAIRSGCACSQRSSGARQAGRFESAGDGAATRGSVGWPTPCCPVG